ncbi:MAG: glycosyltransferase family 2 protein [Pseudomonadota bacterium]
MREDAARVNHWTHPPDRSLQIFEDLPHYSRAGVMPWRKRPDETLERLATGDQGGSAEALKNAVCISRRLYQTKLGERFRDEIRTASIATLRDHAPSSSAHVTLADNQKRILLYVMTLIVLAMVIAPGATFTLFNVLMIVYFAGVVGFRLYLAALSHTSPPAPTEEPETQDRALPVITILLPLYDEAASLSLLSRSIDELDYPRDRLDVKLLLEADDDATISEADRLGLERVFDVITLPPSAPRTKPKACNHGLQLARGDLIVIYDAEDMPERDQLRKAAAAFAADQESRSGGAPLACAQARLNFYNARENWLTRMFALEYALWFDSLLPALERIGAPIPLGGTSNFFRTDILRELGGWDPYNVTEDADLGMRLAMRGYRTRMIASTTYEEANSRLDNWLRQRSRWMKGYLQTWFVLMRRPRAPARVGGWAGLASTHLFLFGTVAAALLQPVMWAAFLLGAMTIDAGTQEPRGALEAANLFALIAGNLAVVALAASAPFKRGWRDLAPFAVFAPLYWQLASLAAFKGAAQLITRPHYWEKTDHHLSETAAKARAQTLDPAA